MLFANTLLSPSSSMYAYKWEIVGFRAAWISITQLPLIYLLAGKINLVTLLTGLSHERLNWLHRWVARTLFLTVVVHWSFFFREWVIADFVQLEMGMMPMVKYGFGAWAVLGWMVVSGFGYFRRVAYEVFVLQHVLSFVVLLWLVYMHVPVYARYNVWACVAFVAFDRGVRAVLLILRNTHLRRESDGSRPRYVFGYRTGLQVISDNHIQITIHNVAFSWKAGQHVFISIPACGILQAHPFTISNTPNSSNEAKFIVKAHSGFTRKLLTHATLHLGRDLRAFVSPAYGSPPLDIVERSDSLILLATSTGVSFIVPILQHAVQSENSIRRICFIWVVRDTAQLEWFEKEITVAAERAAADGVSVRVQMFVTEGELKFVGFDDFSSLGSSDFDVVDVEKRNEAKENSLLAKEQATNTTSKNHIEQPQVNIRQRTSSSSLQSSSDIKITAGRPGSLDDLIRPTVEESDGETAIIACGSTSFMAELRNYTAGLSDERAVHKGTGAQGIFLFTETFGW